MNEENMKRMVLLERNNHSFGYSYVSCVELEFPMNKIQIPSSLSIFSLVYSPQTLIFPLNITFSRRELAVPSLKNNYPQQTWSLDVTSIPQGKS